MSRSFTVSLVLFLSAGGALAAPTAPGEVHQVTMINNCAGGKPVYMRQSDERRYGSGPVHGPVKGGVAWLDGLPGTNCLANGKHCGIIEFTLINKGVDAGDGFNSINYSLLKEGLGDHAFTYPMDFEYTGQCANTKNDGPCLSEENCPLTYWGTDTFSGEPTTTLGDNCGIKITFCPRTKG